MAFVPLHALKPLRSAWPWPWPLPALLAWAAGWVAWLAAAAADAHPAVGFALGLLAAGAVAWSSHGLWRRLLAAAGFPLSALALGYAAGVPPWLWLLLLAPLLATYPVRAWRDAPFFPTPADALRGLDAITGTPQRVLDAGCGLGHGLRALRRLWPQARLHGVEWSPVLAALAALRCRGAHIRRGDMWAGSWADYDLVYLFQRPESMARAWAKAEQELAPGAWLVSLEFAVPGCEPWACLQDAARRPLWIYRAGASRRHSTESQRSR